MKILRTLFYSTLALSLLCTACKSEEEEINASASNAVITAMNLGTLKRFVQYRDAEGKLQTNQITVQGSLYPLTIDHLAASVYNRDSLPYGTDLSHVVMSAFTCSSSYAIRSLYTNTDTVYTYTDSTDFSRPRLLTVYGTDNSSRRIYTIDLRVHQEEGDTMQWKSLASECADVASLHNASACVKGGVIYAFTTANGVPQVRTASLSAPTAWETSPLSAAADGLNTRHIVLREGVFYGVNGQGRVVSSTDAKTWNIVSVAAFTAPKDASAPSLADAGTSGLVALTAEGVCLSTDGGGTFTPQTLDDEATKLPSVLYGTTCTPLSFDDSFESVLLVGQCKGKSMVWRKDFDLKQQEDFPWMYLPATEEVRYPCPVLQSPVVFGYDRASVLVGATADGKLADLYVSRDGGRNWIPKIFPLPAAKEGVTEVAVAVDADTHCVFLLLSGTGEVWRGRINRLGWKTEPFVIK